MRRVAVIAAMPGELAPLVRGWRRESRGGVRLWRLPRADGEWIAACAGMGPGAAARAFAEAERGGPLDLALSVGWAGALSAEHALGSACAVAGVVDDRTGERFPCGPGSCWLVTAAGVADPAEKRRLLAAHGAGLVDMEAAAIARLAAGRGVAFRCIKGVSDGPGDRLPDFGAFIAADGSFRTARFAAFALVRPWLWPALGRIGRASRRASRSVARAALEILGARAGADP